MGYKDKKCSKIKGCDISEDEDKCIECNEYYCLDIKEGKWVYNDEIESNDKKFYYRCIRTNKEGNACEICVEGYELINGICVDNEHCVETNKDEICSKCLNDGQDIFCLNYVFGCVKTFLDNCLECNDYLDFYGCTKCEDGYKLNEFSLCIK